MIFQKTLFYQQGFLI